MKPKVHNRSFCLSNFKRSWKFDLIYVTIMHLIPIATEYAFYVMSYRTINLVIKRTSIRFVLQLEVN